MDTLEVERRDVQELENKEYKNTNCLYRLEPCMVFDYVYVIELPVLSTTKTGFWINHPYKNRKRFVRHNSQFSSTSIELALLKFKERYGRRREHISFSLE